MKQVTIFLAIFFCTVFCYFATAQSNNGFEGSYYTTANNQSITMQIMPYEDGIVGQIIMGNESAEFLGTIQGSESYGLLQETGSEEVSAYHAVVRGNQLDFTITVVDPSTFQSNEVTLNFKRGAPSAATSIATTPSATKTTTQTTNNSNAGGSNSATARQWKDLLADTRLTYMSSYSSGYGDSYGGYSVKRSMDLCSQGYFTYAGSSNFSVNAPGASAYNAGNSGSDGTWVIKDDNAGGAILQLNYADGNVSQFGLGYEDGKTYLNNERWFRITKAEGGENAPGSCY